MKFETIIEICIGGITSPRLVCFDYELDDFPRLDGSPRVDIYGCHVLIGKSWTPCSHLWDILSETQREWIETRMAEGWDHGRHLVVEKETA